MFTVHDYVKYYGDYSFDLIPFNDMDNIVFSTLVYLPLEQILFKNNISLEKMVNLLRKVNVRAHTMPFKSVNLLNEISNTKRYKNIKISDFVSILDDETQFSAFSIRYQKGHLYIAYRGTDNSLVGWKEDFDLFYTYPVPAQKHAEEYLNMNITKEDKVIYIGGHSKGGNLAMSSALNLSKEMFDRVVTIYNNDGPGFLTEQINSAGFRQISSKIRTFIPEESFIGLSLENPIAYMPVKSIKQGIYQHDPTSWLCFGQFLLQGTTSNICLKFQEKVNNWLRETTKKDRKILFNVFFKILNESGVKNFNELKNIKFDKIKAMIDEAKSVDEKSKGMLLETLKILFYRGNNDKPC